MSVHQQTGETAITAAAKLAIPASVTSVTLAGIHLQDWVLIGTLVYTVLMIAEKLWKLYRTWRDEERDDDADE